MILGRSTVQWIALITAAGGLLQLVLVQLVPGVDPVLIGTLIGAGVTFLGSFIAFLANTATTPTATPELKAGTMVRVTNEEGTIIGHEPVPAPSEGGGVPS